MRNTLRYILQTFAIGALLLSAVADVLSGDFPHAAIALAAIAALTV